MIIILKALTKLALAIFFILTLGAFSMFSGSKDRLPREWAQKFNDAVQLTEFAAKNQLDLNGYLVDGARIKSAKLNNFTFSDIDFNDFGGEETVLVHGTFKDCSFNDATFDRAELTNITFEKCKFFDTTFVSATLKNIKFINCDISNTALFNLKESNVEFINTKIHDNDYKLSDSLIQMRLINSELRNTDMRKLKEGSSIYVENSVIDNVSFQYSNLAFIKAIDSKILNTSASDSIIDKIDLYNSELKFSFGRSKLDTINVNNSVLHKFGMVKIQANSVDIHNCNGKSKTSFAKAKIGNINITNCDFSEIYPISLTAQSLTIENSKIDETAFVESTISNLTLKNITFTKEADFTDFNADKATIENITKGPDLKLIMDGANIDF